MEKKREVKKHLKIYPRQKRLRYLLLRHSKDNELK